MVLKISMVLLNLTLFQLVVEVVTKMVFYSLKLFQNLLVDMDLILFVRVLVDY